MRHTEVDERIKDAVDRGMPAVRILGNLEWGRGTPGWPPDREIMRLEACVTGAAERLPSIVVCTYNVNSLPGPFLLKGGLECHPMTFRRDCLRHNEHHVPPEHFLEESVSENVIAGNAMARRAIYMYGALLPRNAQGSVNGGLGQTTSSGTVGLIAPTDTVRDALNDYAKFVGATSVAWLPATAGAGRLFGSIIRRRTASAPA